MILSPTYTHTPWGIVKAWSETGSDKHKDIWTPLSGHMSQGESDGVWRDRQREQCEKRSGGEDEPGSMVWYQCVCSGG